MLRRGLILGLMLGAPLLAAAAVDQPARMIRTVDPRFPDALIHRGVYQGEASAVVFIDAEGRLADWLLTSYTHPLFGREATEALRQWRFEPARRNAEPVDSRTEITFSFQASGIMVTLTGADVAERFQGVGKDSTIRRVCPSSELDGAITPTRTVAPLWPSGWETSAREGRVVLDFYIDEHGRARMPVVVSIDHLALALPAIEALSHWEFAPPTRHGEPVIVRAMQSFRFTRR